MPNLLASMTKGAMQDSSMNGSLKVSIPSDPVQARQIQEIVESALRNHSYEEHDVFGIKLALEEALINAIKHGNGLDRNKHVHIHCHVSPERFEIHIKDEGGGFDPEEVPDPMAPENLERDCGRGILLMRHYMTHVTYHPPGNAVSMIKLRNGQ